MNYREKIRKAIECPQFNNTRYGEWGALTLEQRRYIKRLLDELDSADNYIKNVYLENQKYKEVIDKAIEELTYMSTDAYVEDYDIRDKYWELLLEILTSFTDKTIENTRKILRGGGDNE